MGKKVNMRKGMRRGKLVKNENKSKNTDGIM